MNTHGEPYIVFWAVLGGKGWGTNLWLSSDEIFWWNVMNVPFLDLLDNTNRKYKKVRVLKWYWHKIGW